MLLSDTDIKEELAVGGLVITPLDIDDVQPASVDVHLGPEFQILRRDQRGVINPGVGRDDLFDAVTLDELFSLTLHPGDFVLATTIETVTLGRSLAARLEGVSSLGRLGLEVHSTAGFIDPGFSGQVTLELSNCTPIPIMLRPGMRIGQMCFIRMSSPVEQSYADRGRYQNQSGPTLSRAHLKGNRR